MLGSQQKGKGRPAAGKTDKGKLRTIKFEYDLKPHDVHVHIYTTRDDVSVGLHSQSSGQLQHSTCEQLCVDKRPLAARTNPEQILKHRRRATTT